jgi:hypothetical protein
VIAQPPNLFSQKAKREEKSLVTDRVSEEMQPISKFCFNFMSSFVGKQSIERCKNLATPIRQDATKSVFMSEID